MTSTELEAAPATGRPAWLNRSNALQAFVAATTVLLVAAPLLPILYQSLIDRPLYDAGQQLTADNYTSLVTSPTFWTVARNSLVFAVLTTVIAQGLGAFFAILVGRTDLPGRRFFGEVLLWPLYVSSLVLAFGWFIVYGPAGYLTMWLRTLLGFEPWSLYTILGMAVVAGTSQMPLAMLYCVGSTALANPALEDAARACGAKPAATLWHITLPLLMPAILYSGLLNFTISLEMLSIPLIFGEPARIGFFTTLLYTQGISTPQPNYGLVATGAVVLLVIVMLLVFLQNRLLRNTQRFVTVGGKATRPRPFPLGRLRWPAFAIAAAYAFFFVIAPVGVLLVRASVSFLTPFVPFWTVFTWDNFASIVEYPAYIRSITNTILISLVGGGMATVFIALIAIIVRRSEFRYRRTLEYIALLPRAIPGLVVGIGFFYAIVLLPPLGWIRNSIVLLMVAYTMRYIPTGFGALSPPLMQLAPDLDRSARVSGADWLGTVRYITLPLISPAMFTCFALLFVHFFKEYSAAVFLFAPGSEVIGTTLLQFWVQGNMGRVAALSSIQVIITVAFIYGVRRLMGVKIYG